MEFGSAIEKIGVKVRHTTLNQFPNNHKWFPIDRYKDLVSIFRWEHLSAREHDAYAVTMTMRLRRGKHYHDPLRNSYVFVSSNSEMVGKARNYCLDNRMIQPNQLVR
jgi:hypothetical protein